MKKLIKIILTIILLLFISILVMIKNDNKYQNNLIKEISKNTNIKNIEYLNKYDKYYIVKDKTNIYIYTLEYEEIYKIENSKIKNKKKHHEIIYHENTIMYLETKKTNNNLIFKYYDINTYQLIKEIKLNN